METSPELSFREFYLQDLVGFSIIADQPVSHNWPDIIVLDKWTNKYYFIDVAIPGDVHVKLKTTEKLDKYNCDLQITIQQLWNISVTVVSIIIGALGSVPLDLSVLLKKLDFDDKVIPLLQKIVLLETFNILRRYLSVVT